MSVVLRAFTVSFPAHTVKGPYVSYELPEFSTAVSATDHEGAIRQATRDLHMVGELPSWRPYRRQSAALARVAGRETELERFKRERGPG